MRRGMLVALLTGQTMVSMDGSIVTVAMPHIRAGLHVSGATLQLITGGYILAMAVLVVSGARAGDLFGHRRVFLSGLGGFAAASLACGLAPSGPVLVAARVAQGAAAALVLPQVLSLIQLHFTGPARARALGLYSMVLALGVAIGQLAGGLIVTGFGWRPVFLLNVPVGAALIAMGPLVLPPDAPGTAAAPRATGARGTAGAMTVPDGSGRGGRRFDVIGTALLCAAMIALVVPLVLGREQGWPAWMWVSLAAGAAGLASFGWYAARAEDPLLDLGVLRERGVRPGLAACVAVMGCYTGLIFSLTLRLQTGLGFSALRAGLAFLPYTLGFAAAGLGWPRLPARRFLPVAGLAAFAVAAPLIGLLARGGWPVAAVAPLLVLAGAGHAAGFSPLVEQVAATAGPGRASAVSALTNTGTLLANVLAIATLGGVYLAASRPAEGFMRVTWLAGGILLIAAAGAWRTARVAARPGPGPVPATPPEQAGAVRGA